MLREIRTTLPEPNSSYGREIPSEIAYADDVDFIGHDYANIAKIQETLEKYQLKVFTDKTEFTLLSKSEEDWKKVKKVGSLIDDNEDIERRKQLSSTALSRLNNLWLKDNKIKTVTKIHLYKSLRRSGSSTRSLSQVSTGRRENPDPRQPGSAKRTSGWTPDQNSKGGLKRCQQQRQTEAMSTAKVDRSDVKSKGRPKRRQRQR
ncbi:hypothetical protein ElyMa_001040600 [Elysia marginata]|uniref:Reverse transcriptase domain-containing protein n=1 Tax=Elysia marginata TaxID=1093978 RepID=A0AAV4HRV0_9GAST|nr:hypothetical protein ElyMa_001040600 [Elysia marginata]